jgi:hypothetical protein
MTTFLLGTRYNEEFFYRLAGVFLKKPQELSSSLSTGTLLMLYLKKKIVVERSFVIDRGAT